MEVCGTHTYAFFRFGLRHLLKPYIDFVSGPGCPVCITMDTYIQESRALAKNSRHIIATFGDLLHVPGPEGSLAESKAQGADIRIVYSPQDALELAAAHKLRKVIFLSVGFETTAPLIAVVLRQARRAHLHNFFILCGNRLIPPAMDVICCDPDNEIEAFLCPGHVSAIIGTRPYRKIVEKYHKGCVICGFEPLDIVLSFYLICSQLREGTPRLENTYRRVVRPLGNVRAQQIMREVFFVDDASWRGLGIIKKSGLFLRDEFKQFDARQLIRTKEKNLLFDKGISKLRRGCLCGEVIKGKIRPPLCPRFREHCSPDNPMGPCMVSFEGACRIYYEYRG